MSDFGSLLKVKRDREGLTQQEVSRRLKRKGISLHHSMISRWERGRRLPRAQDRDTVIAIADVLGMTEDEKNTLLVGAGLKPLRPADLDVDKILKGLGPQRWHKTDFLHKTMEWGEQEIGEKLGIPFWDVQHDIERAEEEKPRQEREFFEAVEELTMQPGRGRYLDISLLANTILIDRIIVQPSDTGAPFEFKVFDREQQSAYPGDEDLVLERSSDGRRLRWVPVRPELYQDGDGSKRLHCGIVLRERHIRFDLGEQELQDYLQLPVTFRVTLRYRPLP